MSGAARWIFGYGSLVWRPAFAWVERRPASLAGFARRFWQGSPDHRGVPEAPGRVVTLVPQADARCGGLAYRVAAADWEIVMAGLDARESGGFERLPVGLELLDGERESVAGLVYVAREGNPNFLGPASLDEIAGQVQRSRGRSGSNLEYVLRLARALGELGVEDEHVAAIAARLDYAAPQQPRGEAR